MNKDQLVSLDPKGSEASKVGKVLQVLESVPGPSADPVFVAPKGTKESKAWRVVQAIRVQKVMTESVQIPASLVMVLQVNLVCLAPQDP